VRESGDRDRFLSGLGAEIFEGYPAATLVGAGRDVEVDFLVSASPTDHCGDRRVVLTLEDVTAMGLLERQVSRVEAERRELEAKLRTVVDSLPEGVLVSTLDGDLVHWNPAALAMHGFATLEECRRRLHDFADEFDLVTEDGTVLTIDEWPLARILRGEVVQGEELHIHRRHEDWTRVYQYGGRLVRGADGDPLMAAVTIADVTERRRQADALREREEQLSTSPATPTPPSRTGSARTATGSSGESTGPAAPERQDLRRWRGRAEPPPVTAASGCRCSPLRSTGRGSIARWSASRRCSRP
jgi:PAS domain S-box-containing protein